jgi:hypothetical protein
MRPRPVQAGEGPHFIRRPLLQYMSRRLRVVRTRHQVSIVLADGYLKPGAFKGETTASPGSDRSFFSLMPFDMSSDALGQIIPVGSK